MEFIQYARIIIRWLWLIILASVIAGAIAFLLRARQEAQYQAQVTISIGTILQAPNPDQSDIEVSSGLAQTYAEVLEKRPILEGTIEELGLSMSTGQLRGAVQVQIVPSTPLLEIRVTTADPEQSAAIANEMVQQLILNSPATLTAPQERLIQLSNDQIDRLSLQLESSSVELILVEEQINTEPSDSAILRLTARRDNLINQINQTSANIAQFTTIVADIEQRSSAIAVVEAAEPSGSAIGISATTLAVVGAIVGAVIGTGAGLFVEYLDNSIVDSAEVTEFLDLSVVGSIPRLGFRLRWFRQPQLILNNPYSSTIESYRNLRANLISPDNENRTYILTGVSARDGTTTTVANLASIMAADGLRVLLVDANLRDPMIHRVFGLDNDTGLTTLLHNDPSARNVPDMSEIQSQSVRVISSAQDISVSSKWLGRALEIVTISASPDLGGKLESMLTGSNFENFSRPEDGIQSLRNREIDLVILDSEQSNSSVFDLCKRIRTRASDKIPILILDREGDENLRTIQALQVGANDLLMEPFGDEEFIERIYGLLISESPENAGVNLREALGKDENVPDWLSLLSYCLKDTHIPRLTVMTSGLPPKNPVELLGSDLLRQWVSIFQSSADFDVILFDSPPSLTTSDSLILGQKTDSEIVLLMRVRRTTREKALRCKERIEQAGGEISGLVLNFASSRDTA